uniref:Uncharacterized protein n=1 Tax=Hyaloperonospora arabidopsidis (strain Emoy2) TaxID=559515 RepID=M4BIZ6_HYAAE
MTSKLRWAMLPVLNQWTAKILKDQLPGAGQPSTGAVDRYEHYMFNPAKYPPQERIRLGAICVEKRGQVDTRQSCETARMMNGKSFRVWQKGTSWVDVFHHFWPVSLITQNYSGSTALSKRKLNKLTF